MEYVATFFSHFGAMQFARKLKREDIACQIMPVPRQLSSSCGSCVKFSTKDGVLALVDEEVEKIYRLENGSFSVAVDRMERDE
ncbi:MAG: DUF3343 domain-containing protein [Oscillospiraceae bacterium]|nr:DUF3343 domain-containing protein [Oscillospiraceae bacterium]